MGGSSWPPKPISVPCTAPAAMSAETMAPVETEREAQVGMLRAEGGWGGIALPPPTLKLTAPVSRGRAW